MMGDRRRLALERVEQFLIDSDAHEELFDSLQVLRHCVEDQMEAENESTDQFFYNEDDDRDLDF